MEKIAEDGSYRKRWSFVDFISSGQQNITRTRLVDVFRIPARS